MTPIYVHEETYRICHATVVADLIIRHRYDLTAARAEADQRLSDLRYVEWSRLTEHQLELEL